MQVELAFIPLGKGARLSRTIAPAIDLLESSGLSYELIPSGTCIEGKWGRVMPLIRRCRDRVRETFPHVITMIKIQDELRLEQKLPRNVSSEKEQMEGNQMKVEQIGDRAPITAETPPSHP